MMKNRLFRNTCMLAALSVAAASCADDEFAKGGKLSDGAIGFGTSAVTAGDGSPLSRAVHYGDTPLVLLDKSGNDTLYLHTSTERNLSTVTGEKQATRGVPVNDDNFSEVCKSFGVTALTPDGQTLMDDEEIGDYSGGVWLPEETRYWPSDEMEIDFYAYAPYYYNDKKMFGEGDATKVNISDRSIEFSYIVPLSIGRTDDASAQPDIMFCHKACSKNGVDPETGAVPLHFQHALAGVRFVAGDISECTVKTITIENVYGEGSCVYAFDDDDDPFTWKTTGDATSYFCQTFDVAVADSQTGEQQITDKNPVTTFMMIPQELSDNARIKVELLMPDNSTETLTGSLNGQNWEAGNIYTYKISTESINWEYVFEVRASGTSNPATITMPLGGTTGKYEVISYRRRVQQTDVIQPVKWSAAENSAKETNMESGAVSDINFDDVVTDFTTSGDGGKDASSYNIVIDRARMHTSYDGDEILQNAALVGSPENPYDLSLDDGYSGSRNTANCYIVSAAGTYKLPLVYGNGIVNNGTNSNAFHSTFKDYQGKQLGPGTDPWITHHYTPKDCILVWSDGFYMFENVHLDGDYLVFSLNKEYMQQANAIVAVRDAGGTIMWSWHIWVTEHDVYNENVYGLQDWVDGTLNAYQLMGWNLGWVDGKMVYYNQRDLSYTFTQDVSGRTAVLNVKQEGDALDYKDVGSTYYQWGRKDPIVALRNRNAVGRDDYRPQETIEDKYKYDLRTGPTTISESIRNPNIYYTRSSSNAWLNTSDFTTYLWDTSSPANADVKTSTKTIYDPSPRGYKIPPSRAFLVFVNGNVTDKGGSLNGDMINDYQYDVWTQRDKRGTKLTLTSTGQRADRDKQLEVVTGGPKDAEIGGLWAMDGVYYMTCKVSGDPTASYVLCIRKPAGYFASRFGGAQTMARPVRCIKE